MTRAQDRLRTTISKVEVTAEDNTTTLFNMYVRQLERRKLHTTELCMLRLARGKTRLDHVRNVDIWKEAHMYLMAEFLREKRLRWFGHVQRRDKDEATRKIIQMTEESEIEADQS